MAVKKEVKEVKMAVKLVLCSVDTMVGLSVSVAVAYLADVLGKQLVAEMAK